MALVQLELEMAKHVEIKRRLLDLYPDIDENTLADTLEGATDLNEILVVVARSILDDEAMAKALKERIDAMRQRYTRFEERVVSKRQMVLDVMQSCALPKIMQPDFTASLRKAPPSVEIDNETALPCMFPVEQAPKPDKRAILAAISNGQDVPGARLAPARTTLALRSA